jgi:hypothetical protein
MPCGILHPVRELFWAYLCVCLKEGENPIEMVISFQKLVVETSLLAETLLFFKDINIGLVSARTASVV